MTAVVRIKVSRSRLKRLRRMASFTAAADSNRLSSRLSMQRELTYEYLLLISLMITPRDQRSAFWSTGLPERSSGEA